MSLADEMYVRARAEALQAAAEMFNQLDLNGDGSVDRAELLAMTADPQRGESVPEDFRDKKITEFFQTFDANGDGLVQKEEWLSFFGDLFDQVFA